MLAHVVPSTFKIWAILGTILTLTTKNTYLVNNNRMKVVHLISSFIDKHDQSQHSANTLESQQEEIFQVAWQKRSYNKIMVHNDIPFDPPYYKHFIVNNLDLSDALHRMQLLLKEHKWKLSKTIFTRRWP